MYIELNFIFKPFLIAFFICWVAFSLLLIFKPHLWIDFQNRYSKSYGYQLMVTDEKRFLSTFRNSGILLLIFGVLFIVFFCSGFFRTLILMR